MALLLVIYLLKNLVGFDHVSWIIKVSLHQT